MRSHPALLWSPVASRPNTNAPRYYAAQPEGEGGGQRKEGETEMK